MVMIARADPDQDDIRALLTDADAYAASLYPPESNHLLDIDSLMEPNVRFFAARSDGGQAIGCGALVLHADGTGEIKRMWVAPAARGLKLGRKLLDTIEKAAREEGIGLLRLETGVSQPEAIGLYTSAGYVEIGPFGSYGPDPLSVFMQRRLGQAGA